MERNWVLFIERVSFRLFKVILFLRIAGIAQMLNTQTKARDANTQLVFLHYYGVLCYFSYYQ